MALSSNPILKAAGLSALPKKMTVIRHGKIGLTPTLAIPKAKADIVISYYDFIRSHSSTRTPLFEEVYKHFYMRNTFQKGWTASDYNAYFSCMFSFSSKGTFKTDVNFVALHLQSVLHKNSYELSFSSKLVHTRNNNCPIFDNKVMDYLMDYEGVIPTKRTNLLAKYEALINWYDNFIKTDSRYALWIEWFDATFPSYAGIHPVKKIDFVLFFGA